MNKFKERRTENTTEHNALARRLQIMEAQGIGFDEYVARYPGEAPALLPYAGTLSLLNEAVVPAPTLFARQQGSDALIASLHVEGPAPQGGTIMDKLALNPLRAWLAQPAFVRFGGLAAALVLATGLGWGGVAAANGDNPATSVLDALLPEDADEEGHENSADGLDRARQSVGSDDEEEEQEELEDELEEEEEEEGAGEGLQNAREHADENGQQGLDKAEQAIANAPGGGSEEDGESQTEGGPPEGTPQGPPEGTPQGPPEGTPQGPPEGTPQGPPEDTTQGPPEGTPQGPPEDTTQGPPEGITQGPPEGITQGPSEGTTPGGPPPGAGGP